MARDWKAAHRFVRDDGCCLVCGGVSGLDPAHIWPRGRGGDESRENIATLCRVHHAQFDSGAIDLAGYLTGEQVAKVVLLAARFQGNGLEAARMRLVPSAYRERRAV